MSHFCRTSPKHFVRSALHAFPSGARNKCSGQISFPEGFGVLNLVVAMSCSPLCETSMQLLKPSGCESIGRGSRDTPGRSTIRLSASFNSSCWSPFSQSAERHVQHTEDSHHVSDCQTYVRPVDLLSIEMLDEVGDGDGNVQAIGDDDNLLAPTLRNKRPAS